jgi:hypothetical protein
MQTCYIVNFNIIITSVDTEMCCPKGKCGCQYFILLYLSIYFLKEIKMLLFHIFNTETIDQSIVSCYLTGNVTRFHGILMPCPDWINVLYLFGTFGLHPLLAKTFEIF